MAKNPNQIQDDTEQIVGTTEGEVSNTASDDFEEADDLDEEDDSAEEAD